MVLPGEGWTGEVGNTGRAKSGKNLPPGPSVPAHRSGQLGRGATCSFLQAAMKPFRGGLEVEKRCPAHVASLGPLLGTWETWETYHQICTLEL